MFNLQFILVLIVLLTVVSLVTSLMIEAIKKVVSDETIKKYFKSLEIFSLVFTMIVAVATFLIFLLFYIKEPVVALDIFKLVITGILFTFACGCGSQVGYDKVIKVVKQIIELLGGTNDKLC